MEQMYDVPITNWIFLTVWFIVLGFGLYKHVENIMKGEIEEEDNKIIAYFLIMYFAALFIAHYFYFSNIEYLLEKHIGYFGYLVQIVAICFAIWTLKSYGKYWTYSLITFKNHKVITTGPNAIVRHPFYLANFLFLLGYTLSLRTLLSLLGAFVALGFLIYMIDIEEQFNIKNLGEEYKEYMKKVKYKILPYIY